MSDIRLVMAGSVIVFCGLIYGGMKAGEYLQFTIQEQNFDECFDYSTGYAVHVKCEQKMEEKNLYLATTLAIVAIGSFIIIKGIRGKWDQSVKSSDMVGPK